MGLKRVQRNKEKRGSEEKAKKKMCAPGKHTEISGRDGYVRMYTYRAVLSVKYSISRITHHRYAPPRRRADAI